MRKTSLIVALMYLLQVQGPLRAQDKGSGEKETPISWVEAFNRPLERGTPRDSGRTLGEMLLSDALSRIRRSQELSEVERRKMMDLVEALIEIEPSHPAFTPLFVELDRESDPRTIAAESDPEAVGKVVGAVRRLAGKMRPEFIRHGNAVAAGQSEKFEAGINRAVLEWDGKAPFDLEGAAVEPAFGGGRAEVVLTHAPETAAGSTQINDASRLNPTRVATIIKPKTVTDLRNALAAARKYDLKVTVAGARHSMGGQAFFKNAMILDMTEFNAMSLDKENRILTVQTGATWSDVQKLLDGEGLAVDVMQAINHVTVGGALSVNAHGNNPDSGAFASTVLSIRIMRPDGTLVTASREENPELFHLALGGYGLFGIIVDARLKVRENEVYELETKTMDYKQYPEFFEKNLAGDSPYGYIHAFLSTDPDTYMREMFVMAYRRVDGPVPEKLPENPTILKGLSVLFRWADSSPSGKRVMWRFLKNAVPTLAPTRIFSRNQAMEHPDSVFTDTGEKRTLILQDYFLPQRNLLPFIDRLREVSLKNKVNIIIVNIRPVKKDDATFLAYAKGEDRFGVVLNLIQPLTNEEKAKMARFTREIINEALALNGTFYLPYQLAYTPEQLKASYPEAEEFFRLKRQYDPEERFQNNFYDKYGKQKTGEKINEEKTK